MGLINTFKQFLIRKTEEMEDELKILKNGDDKKQQEELEIQKRQEEKKKQEELERIKREEQIKQELSEYEEMYERERLKSEKNKQEKIQLIKKETQENITKLEKEEHNKQIIKISEKSKAEKKYNIQLISMQLKSAILNLEITDKKLSNGIIDLDSDIQNNLSHKYQTVLFKEEKCNTQLLFVKLKSVILNLEIIDKKLSNGIIDLDSDIQNNLSHKYQTVLFKEEKCNIQLLFVKLKSAILNLEITDKKLSNSIIDLDSDIQNNLSHKYQTVLFKEKKSILELSEIFTKLNIQ